MTERHWWILFVGLVITFLGVVTKKFFFLLLFFPFSFLFKKDREE